MLHTFLLSGISVPRTILRSHKVAKVSKSCNACSMEIKMSPLNGISGLKSNRASLFRNPDAEVESTRS